MYHCTKFNANNVWYLEPNELFENRELRFGTCPICNKGSIELREKRKVDGKTFVSRVTGDKINKIIDKEKVNVIYSSNDINKMRIPFGWRFGVNILTKTGDKQYACDWFNNKELVKNSF